MGLNTKQNGSSSTISGSREDDGDGVVVVVHIRTMNVGRRRRRSPGRVEAVRSPTMGTAVAGRSLLPAVVERIRLRLAAAAGRIRLPWTAVAEHSHPRVVEAARRDRNTDCSSSLLNVRT